MAKQKEIKQITINIKNWIATDAEIEDVKKYVLRMMTKKTKTECDILLVYREKI